MNQATPPTSPRPGGTSTWLLLGGVFLILLAVLGVTTHDRLQRSKELMIDSLTQHGTLLVRSLEGATRAGMRRGMWRLTLLQALAEEMADHPHVHSIAIIGSNGEVMATAGRGQSHAAGAHVLDPRMGLPDDLRARIKAQEPLNDFIKGALVIGRPFEPLGNYLRRQGKLPSWALPLNQRGDLPPGAGRGMTAMMNHMRPPPPTSSPMMDAGMQGGHNGPMTGYALVRMSSKSFEEARKKDLEQVFALTALIFLAAGAVSVGLMAFARRRQSEIEKLRKEVADNQHLAAVGRLAASVAHEVRNPLSALRGMVQYLSKDADPGSRKAEYAEVAVSEVDRLNRVVSGLLDYSRPSPPRQVELDLAEVMRGVVELFRDDPLAHNVDIAVTSPDTLPPVMADPDQIRQVLLNLVLNALQAMDGKGSLTLEAGADGKNVFIKVRDTGPGLPQGDPEEVFDPFFSTKDRGTGLGLAIARRIAQGHGGELTAGKGQPGGAVFTLSLPLNGDAS